MQYPLQEYTNVKFVLLMLSPDMFCSVLSELILLHRYVVIVQNRSLNCFINGCLCYSCFGDYYNSLHTFLQSLMYFMTIRFGIRSITICIASAFENSSITKLQCM